MDIKECKKYLRRIDRVKTYKKSQLIYFIIFQELSSIPILASFAMRIIAAVFTTFSAASSRSSVNIKLNPECEMISLA